MNKAVLIMAYGGPDNLNDIEPYLLDVRGGRPTSPELIAEIRSRYAQIGGRSPLLDITQAQASGLEKALDALSSSGDSYQVFVGMRHWKPTIRDAVDKIAAAGYQDGLALCMAPHASKMSSGAYLAKLKEALSSQPTPPAIQFIESWHDQPFLIQSLAQKVHEATQKFTPDARGGIYYLFTAHALPAALNEQGDPYAEQVQATARLLANELGLTDARWTFGFQSAPATAGQWMKPAIEELLPSLAKKGYKDILVTPVGFMADHVEVLYDLDIAAQQIARQNGIHLVRSESLNDSPHFLDGLARFILDNWRVDAIGHH